MTKMTGTVRTPDAVVFDVGGVLGASGPGANFHALLRQLPGWADCPGDALNAALQAPRPDYDRGSLDDEGYWAAVAAGLGRARLNATQIAPLVAADIDHYTTWDLAAATLFTTLRQVGQRLAILAFGTLLYPGRTPVGRGARGCGIPALLVAWIGAGRAGIRRPNAVRHSPELVAAGARAVGRFGPRAVGRFGPRADWRWPGTA